MVLKKNKNINILGINIFCGLKAEAEDIVFEMMKGEEQNYIVTANPEIIMTASNDEEYFHVINSAALVLTDGFGLKIAGWVLGCNLPRLTGADLMYKIFARAEKENKSVGLISWKHGLSRQEDIVPALERLYPKLSFLILEADREETDTVCEKLNQFKPEIILVGIGAPWQEKFISQNLKNMPSVKLGIGIGGSFDFLSGKIKRAPKIFQNFGLEWFWRLIMQARSPERRKRVLRAVLKFPIKFIRWRFVLPFLYRKNVACLLYKIEKNGYYILLVKRRNEESHWQLPQGGLDGEDIKKAGLRELAEELNNCKCRPVAEYKNLWKYKFNNYAGRYGGGGYGYKGQKQSLLIADFIGQDNEIKINNWDHSDWKWVRSEDFLNSVHPIRKEAYTIYFEKFKKLMLK